MNNEIYEQQFSLAMGLYFSYFVHSLCCPSVFCYCRVVNLMMSPINDTFLSGSLDRTIRLWDLRSPNCQGLMHLNGPPVASFDPEGLIFAAGIDSRQLKLYDLRTFDKVLAIHIYMICAMYSGTSLLRTSKLRTPL